MKIGWILQETKINNNNTFKVDLFEKKKSSSLTAELEESLPWAAFFTPAYPNRALIELGLYDLAVLGSVGPNNYLHFFTQLSEINSIPTTKSEHINSMSPL